MSMTTSLPMMVAETTLPVDRDVRRRALDPERSFIVQAPAGSGKTELLARRFLRLLATVSAPEEILAITFTRKAAAEMRKRIVDALALGRTDIAPPEPHRREVWELARAACAQDARQGWGIAAHPARLRVLTIDALNLSLARRLPVLSGLGAAPGIAVQPLPLYREAVRRLIARLGEPGREAAAIARVIGHLDNDLGTLERMLISMLERREHWLDLGLLRLDAASLRRPLEDALALAVGERLDAVTRAIPVTERTQLVTVVAEAASALLAERSSSPVAACAGLAALPSADAADLPAWKGVAELLLTQKGEWRKRVDVKLGFPTSARHRKDACIALLDVLRGETELAAQLHALRVLPDPRYADPQWQLLDALLTVLKIAVLELELVFIDRGEADFPAIAIAARRALGTADAPTDLALRLDYRLRHVLVDEFQDTSRSQIELLRLLTAGWTRGDGRTLFCVGDPMQSIYRFRDAEVGLFLDVARRGLDDIDLEALRLTVNFRSTRPIVDWINRTLVDVLPKQDDPTRGAIAFAGTVPGPIAGGEGGVFVHPFVGTEMAVRRQEARRIVTIVRAARESHPGISIAILVASRTHLPAALAELRKASVPVRATEIDPLADRPVVQDLIALTRALVHLGDRTAWLAILRAPWCGLELADLHALAADAPTLTVIELLHDETRRERLRPDVRARLEGVIRALDAALAARGRHDLREWVERTWNALGGPACLASATDLDDADAYLARLEQLDDGGDLEEVARLETALGDLYGTASLATEDAVDVMTIHRAKGLEFDVVILPALDRLPRSEDKPLLRWTELPHATRAPSIMLAPVAAQGDAPDPLHEWLGRLEAEKSAFERGRLLYVAATRAIRELHLLGGVEADESGATPCREPPAGSFLALTWPHLGSEFAMRGFAVETKPPQSANGRATLRYARLPGDWQRPAPHAAVLETLPITPIEDAPLRPEFDWATETTRHVGTVVHREIERFLAGGSDLDSFDVEARTDAFAAALAELGVPRAHLEAATVRVASALSNMRDDERGRWLLGGEHEGLLDASTELALTGFAGDQLVNGVIDRTFVTSEGVRYIVDFKTSSHEGSGRDAFLANEAARYRPQLARYAHLMRAWEPDRTVRAALYFPLMRAWVEVDV